MTFPFKYFLNQPIRTSMKTPTPKRPGPKPKAFQYSETRIDGSYRVCYATASGPRGLVFAVFDAADLDIARSCCPEWSEKAGVYRIVRHLTRAEKDDRVALGRKAGSMVRAEELVTGRVLGRPLAGSPDEVTDHVNSDALDNRRENLRVLSNRLNTILQSDVKLGYRLPGATFDTSCGRWQARWCEPGCERKRLGRFATEYEAFLAYQARLERAQPGASIAFAAHPLLLARLDLLAT